MLQFRLLKYNNITSAYGCLIAKTIAKSKRSPNVTMVKSVDELNFVNCVLQHLPIDLVKDNYGRTVHNACFSLVKPTPLTNPKLVCYSLKAFELLDLNIAQIDDDHFINCFTGNEIMNGSEPASHCYCGHQFGINNNNNNNNNNLIINLNKFRSVCWSTWRRSSYIFGRNC